MAATTGFAAGVESGDVLVSYAVEATWGTLPSSAFQAIRMMSESLGGSKTRTRPNENTTNAEVAQAVTSAETASGAINFALSYGTYDDILSSVLGADWQGAQAINGSTGDITFTNVDTTSGTLSSTTSNKFSAITIGQWIRLLGFTNAANNGYWRVSAKADTTHLTLKGFAAPVTETPTGSAAKVRANTIKNGTQFKSLYFQKMLSSALFLQYPGTFISQATLSGSVGQFLSGSFNVLSKDEISATDNASTGAVIAAPSGTVNNPVGNFKGIFLSEAAISAVADQFSIQIQRTGAAAEYGLGSSAAQGMLKGQLEVSGSIRMFFRSFTEYALFKAETTQRISFITEDGAGNGYVITLLNGALMNPKINAGGVNQPVYATFDLEGSPQSGGGTIQLDALPNS